MKRIFNLIITLLIFAAVSYTFYTVERPTKKVSKKASYRLLIKGDNITYKNEPFIENDTAYIPLDTINKLFDDYLFYDESTNKITYTDYDKVVKYKIGETKKTVNFKEEETKYPMLEKEGVIYIPVAEFSEYDLDIRFDIDNKMITLDDPKFVKSKIKQSDISVYTKMDLNSRVVTKLNYDDIVYVYEDKLEHPRWLKVSTEKGCFGYIPKVEYEKQKQDAAGNILDEKEKVEEKEKVVMFWQQGNSLSVLGKKIEGVNTVSPDWFDIKDTNGNFEEKIDQNYLNKVKEYGYKVWPMFSNVNTKNATSIISTIMNDESKREKTIINILNICKKYKLDGVNLDFEMMKTEEKHLFTQFVRELAPILRANNITLSVDIYFVNYIERYEIGKAADYVILMAYDQHWNGSSVAGSVAELSWVETNVNSLLNDSKIESKKIILGVPFYSKLWKETPSLSKPTASNLSLEAAKKFVSSNGIKTTVDEKSGQNYAQKTAANTTYKLWLEDEYSIAKRAKIVKDLELGGISAWQKFFDTESIWDAIIKNIK